MTTAPPLSATDAVGPGARERRCVRCGYSLAGHDENGRCPECGLRTYWSLHAPEQLSQYPAKWVASVVWATRILAAAYGGMFLLLLAGFLNLLNSAPRITAVGLLAGGTLQAVGAWMLSRPSRHWNEARAVGNRLVLRVASLAPVVAGAIGVYVEATTAIYPEWLRLAMLAGLCGWVVAPPAVFLRLRAVARMIADEGLARRSAAVGWGLLVALLVLAVGLADLIRSGHDADPFTRRVVQVVSVAVVSWLLAFLLLGAYVMLRCVRDFGHAATVARRDET